MKSYDPNGDDPTSWLIQYRAWKTRVTNATNAQNAALAASNAAAAKAAQLNAWHQQLASVLADMSNRAGAYAAANSTISTLNAQLADLDGQLADHSAARDTATSRLVGPAPLSSPALLLPVRVQTAWAGQTLCVRILPSELNLDRHDPRLSPMEQTLGQAYWATRNRPGDTQADQAWADLTRRVTPQRAAWIVRATDPAATIPVTERDDLDTAVTVRLLPDRFAVVLLAQGEPVNVSSTSPTFITWGQPIPPTVEVPLLASADTATWMTDLDTAAATGLAIRIPLPTSAPVIDELIVVGLRSGSTPADLADLLEHHVYGAGIELLPEGVPTNNSVAGRTIRNADRDAAMLKSLVASPPPSLTSTSAGQQAAALLGIPAARMAIIPGAAGVRGTVTDAVSVLVRSAATGTLTRRYGVASGSVPSMNPAGAAPALRVGKQPYGLLATVETGRWLVADAVDTVFAGALQDAASGHLAPLDVDPAAPPTAATAPRRATRDDDSLIPLILVEGASSVRWASSSGMWSGLDAVVGPAAGPQSPATYLDQLAQGIRTPDVLSSAGTSVLGSLAAAAATAPGAATALATLASAAADDAGRQEIAVALGEHLDALSHRVDCWVTAAAAHRRSHNVTGPPVIGAYGYLTDVAPRPTGRPRSFGHILAPSLGHAATAAVLRSGYLGQRRAAWAARLADAIDRRDHAAAAAARAGLSTLAPLDAATEARLPMAVDLSSRRIRRARWILGAVREGQPLAAVLGQQFERGLVDAGLQRYLAAFRKLTRFRTGSELESLEAARRAAADTVAQARANAAVAEAVAAEAAGPLADAQAAAQRAQTQRDAATSAWAPFQAQVDLRNSELALAQDAQNTLNALLARPPATTTRTKTVLVP
ncbi:hypothetical protein GCM10027517_21270 [Phycicoccus ginsengisoli]